MTALMALVLAAASMWAVQAVLLCRAGQPVRWRISAADLPRSLKRVNRAATYAVFALLLLLYPLAKGSVPWEYYGRFFPADARAAQLGWGAGAATLYLALLYLAWSASGNVRLEVRHGGWRLAQRLAGAPLTAIAAAGFEELVFRAILLEDLLETWPDAAAVAGGALVFAGAHYVRAVKRYWTFPGHVALGVLFCVAFVAAERTLWLPVGLHAGGVLMLLGVRPLARYMGPAWLVGASIFPYAGVVGIAALGLLTCNVWLAFGGE